MRRGRRDRKNDEVSVCSSSGRGPGNVNDKNDRPDKKGVYRTSERQEWSKSRNEFTWKEDSGRNWCGSYGRGGNVVIKVTVVLNGGRP